MQSILQQTLLSIVLLPIIAFQQPVDVAPQQAIPEPVEQCDLMEKDCFLEELEKQVNEWGLTQADFFVLQEIAQRERNFVCKDNRGLNKNGTIDWCYFQINDIWEGELKRYARIGKIDGKYADLDFRYNVEEHITTALIIYIHRGIGEWTSMK